MPITLNKSQKDVSTGLEAFSRVLAPAGSGKTITLLWKCLRDSELSKGKNKYLIFTFTRVARDELRERLNNLPEFSSIKKLTRIETLNQWGYNYLKGIKDGLQLKTSKQDYYFLLNNNLRPLWEEKPFLAKLAKLTYKYNDIVNIFSELKTLGFSHKYKKAVLMTSFNEHLIWLEDNNLLNYFNEKIYSPLFELELLDFSKKDDVQKLKPFIEFWQKSSDELWDQSIITLEDQKYWALTKMNEQYQDGKAFPVPQRYNHILVDEFQDINPLDLMLIKKLSELNKSKLTIVGDDDQAIFEWRASSPNFILKPEDYFNQEFKTYLLDINYRSPKNIVDLSQMLIKNNKRRVDKRVIPNSTNEALIKIKEFANHIDSIQFVIKLAEEYTKKGGKEKIAVISRKKAQLIPIQITLTSKDIDFFAKEDLNVLLSKAFNDLKRILEIVAEKNQRKSSENIVEEILLMCNNVHRYSLKKDEYTKLRKYLISKSPRTFSAGLRTLQDYPDLLKSKSVDGFYQAIYNVINNDTVAEVIESIGDELQGLQKHYAKSDDDIFYKDPPFMYLVEYAERYNDNFWEFIEHVEVAINKMVSYEDYPDEFDEGIKSNIHLMTALRAKGKEFETVIILDANDEIWPIKHAKTEFELEQERRLFYVAMTRAKKTLIFLTIDEMLGRKMNISPYLKEMGLK